MRCGGEQAPEDLEDSEERRDLRLSRPGHLTVGWMRVTATQRTTIKDRDTHAAAGIAAHTLISRLTRGDGDCADGSLFGESMRRLWAHESSPGESALRAASEAARAPHGPSSGRSDERGDPRRLFFFLAPRCLQSTSLT